MALTPKIEHALLIAFHAPGVTLNRCAAGYFDRSRGPRPDPAVAVHVRTANALVDAGWAEYNDPHVPSSLTLTPAGVRVACATLDAQEQAAA